jgi:hypothetical protein
VGAPGRQLFTAALGIALLLHASGVLSVNEDSKTRAVVGP